MQHSPTPDGQAAGVWGHEKGELFLQQSCTQTLPEPSTALSLWLWGFSSWPGSPQQKQAGGLEVGNAQKYQPRGIKLFKEDETLQASFM